MFKNYEAQQFHYFQGNKNHNKANQIRTSRKEEEMCCLLHRDSFPFWNIYIYTFTSADFYIYFLHSCTALPIAMILQDEMKNVKDKDKANTTKSLGLNTDTTDYYFNLVLLGQYLLTI